MRPIPWPYAALIQALTVGLLVFFGIAYVGEQQRNICGMIVILDDRNQHLPPPPDQETADFRAELHRYRHKIGC